MDSFQDEENYHTFQNTMLKVLIVEFLRETNIEFSVVDNDKFRRLMRFVKPDVALPTASELIKLNVEQFDTFKSWENEPLPGEKIHHERVRMAQNWMTTDSSTTIQDNVASLSNCFRFRHLNNMYYPGSSIFTFRMRKELDKSLSPENTHFFPHSGPGTSAFSKVSEIENSEISNVHEVKSEPLSDYDDMPVETKPSLDDLKREMMSTFEEKLNRSGDEQAEPPVKKNKSTVMEMASTSLTMESSSINRELEQGETDTIKLDSDSLLHEPKSEKNKSRSDNFHANVPSTQPYIPKIKKNYKNPAKYTTFQDVPGYVKWPCLMCNERQETMKVRSVNNNDAYIMIYVCVLSRVYTLEKAKEIAKMQKFKCCVTHLNELYEGALHYLDVVDPNIDVHTENEKIVEAYHIVKCIKDSRFVQKLVFEGSRKHIVPFCNTLKHFFEKYARQSYIPRPIQSSLLPPITIASGYEEGKSALQ